jgi:glycosyltransferase involved in cell wall biosynthesis
MIVRDETENLPLSLKPLADVADDIVVVDTGSKDGTRSLAREYGARVFDFPWRDDFAAARNQALLSARSDYILWLDADNSLAPEGFLRLKSALPPLGGRGAILMALEKVLPQGDELWQKRVFPLNGGTRFQGRIHEQLVHGEDLEIVFTDVTISHWGYRDAAAARKKGERNLRLLLAAPETLRGDPYYLYQAGRTLANLRRWDEALSFLQRTIAARSAAPPSLWSHAHLLAANCHKAQGRAEAALEVLRRLARLAPAYGPGRYFLGKFLYAEGLADEALAELSAASALSLEDRVWGANAPQMEFTCLSLLAKILRDRGEGLKATAFLERALRLFPAHPEPRVALAEICLAEKKLSAAADHLRLALRDAPHHRRARALFALASEEA